MKGKSRWAVVCVTLSLMLAGTAHAAIFDDGIPEGWTCEGTCGVAIADGVVRLAPSAGARYGWVATTASPLRSLGLPEIGGTNGSRLRSPPFAAKAGEPIEFQFNYLTSDGAGYADYAWARLLDTSLQPVALLFTARTRSSGNIVPGFGMPEIAAEIDPATVTIIGGGPRWSPLGGDTGRCYASGCGYTDWVHSRYLVPESGDYVLEFGVVNWADTLFQSGLAFDGLFVGGRPIGAEPEYRDVWVTVRLAGEGIVLDSGSFSVPPVRVEHQQGKWEVQWFFETFSLGQVEDLEYAVTLTDPQPGEARAVVEEVQIRYRDLLGDEHQSTLGALNVEVLRSGFAMQVATDRQVYVVGDPLSAVLHTVNTGTTEAVPGIEWAVRDAAGNLAAPLPEPDGWSFAPGESRTLEVQGLETTGLYAGVYRVSARLRDPLTDMFIEASAPFQIAAPVDAGLRAGIRADRPAYDVHDNVEISARIENTAPNQQLSGHQAILMVYDPDGVEVWRTDVLPGTLLPGALQDHVRTLPIGAAPAGEYRARLLVFDQTGAVAAISETRFIVRSTTETGAGLYATVLPHPQPVLRSEILYLEATITNDGNAPWQTLPVSLSLVDLEDESEIAAWGYAVGLDVGETQTVSATWSVDAPADTRLVAVLRGQIQGEYRTLASAPVRVQDRLVSNPDLEGRGRVLVLLDPPHASECRAVDGVRLRIGGNEALLEGDRLQVDLYDASGRLVDSETLEAGERQVVDRVPGFGVNLVLHPRDPDGVELALVAHDGGVMELQDHRVHASHHRGGVVTALQSGPLTAACADLPDPGTQVGDFQLIEVMIRSDGPSARRRGFLEALLDAHGWSYTVVTNGITFAEQLRQGGHASFLLLADRVKLNHPVALELRQAVLAGRGIVQAGAEDHRNHHLLEVFGADLLGLQPHATGLDAVAPSVVGVPRGSFPAVGRAVELRLHDGLALAEYVGSNGQRPNATAVAVHGYGQGRTLLAGFDLLAQAEAQGAGGDFARFLLEALEYTRPNPAIGRAGMAVPVRWDLFNRGGAGSLVLTLELAGGRIADPGSGDLLGPDSIAFPVELPQGGKAELLFWWQLPLEPEVARVTANIDLQEGLLLHRHDVRQHAFAVQPLPDFSELQAQLEGLLGLHEGYSAALEELEKAEALYRTGAVGSAVLRLLEAARSLAGIPGPEADSVRESVAWLVFRLSGEISDL